jgi:putative endonuclease
MNPKPLSLLNHLTVPVAILSVSRLEPNRASYTRESQQTGEVVRVAFVYLLRCGDGSLYCGWTVDLDARLDKHAAGRGARYTRSRLPVALAAAWATPDRTTARRLEAHIKTRTRAEKERLLAGAPLLGAEAVR